MFVAAYACIYIYIVYVHRNPSPRIEWRECNRQVPAILSSKWVSIVGTYILTTFDIESTSKAINIIFARSLLGNILREQMINVLGKSNSSSIYIYNIAFCSAIGIWRLRVHLRLIPIFIRRRAARINLADSSAHPKWIELSSVRGYSTIRRNNSLIRRRCDTVWWEEDRAGRRRCEERERVG